MLQDTLIIFVFFAPLNSRFDLIVLCNTLYPDNFYCHYCCGCFLSSSFFLFVCFAYDGCVSMSSTQYAHYTVQWSDEWMAHYGRIEDKVQRTSSFLCWSNAAVAAVFLDTTTNLNFPTVFSCTHQLHSIPSTAPSPLSLSPTTSGVFMQRHFSV